MVQLTIAMVFIYLLPKEGIKLNMSKNDFHKCSVNFYVSSKVYKPEVTPLWQYSFLEFSVLSKSHG